MDPTNDDRAARPATATKADSDAAAASPHGNDREDAVLARFEQRRHQRMALLVTPGLVAEHRRALRGDVSPSLQAVLVAMRQEPVGGKLVVHETVSGREWRLLRLSGRPGVRHQYVDERCFDSLDDALHAVFLQRLVDWDIEVVQ